MKSVSEMCCDKCREKVAAIAERDQRAAVMIGLDDMAQAVADRRELLNMMENLLGTLAKHRARWHEMEKLVQHKWAAELEEIRERHRVQ